MKVNLEALAERYETIEFLDGDPSWFMHQVTGDTNKELLAFIASCLSYGSRKQFMPKIQSIMDFAHGDITEWILSSKFMNDIPYDENRCFYRLYSFATMNGLLLALHKMLTEYGSIKNYLISFYGQHKEPSRTMTCLDAISAIIDFFSKQGITGIIPKNTQSSCKRLCMFLRWMVRDNSPVDLGLWSDIIDKRTLIMPLDTHVLQEASRLGLLESKTATMSTAIRLTERLKSYFPNDPVKGDYALFGLGVSI